MVKTLFLTARSSRAQAVTGSRSTLCIRARLSLFAPPIIEPEGPHRLFAISSVCSAATLLTVLDKQ